jgi:hypothetical protein
MNKSHVEEIRFCFFSLPSICSFACMVYTDTNTCVVRVIFILAAIIQSSEFAKNACENVYVFYTHYTFPVLFCISKSLISCTFIEYPVR